MDCNGSLWRSSTSLWIPSLDMYMHDLGWADGLSEPHLSTTADLQCLHIRVPVSLVTLVYFLYWWRICCPCSQFNHKFILYLDFIQTGVEALRVVVCFLGPYLRADYPSVLISFLQYLSNFIIVKKVGNLCVVDRTSHFSNYNLPTVCNSSMSILISLLNFISTNVETKTNWVLHRGYELWKPASFINCTLIWLM
jgi:hypothetical protein